MEQVDLARAFVPAFDFQPPVQVGQFLKTLFQRFVGEFRGFKDAFIRQKAHGGAVAVRFAHGLQFFLRHAPAVALFPAPAVPPHRDFQPLRQGVDARNAHPVQPAGNLVRAVVELAPGMEFRHDHLHGGNAFPGVDVHGDAAPVVAHGHAVVEVQNHFDARAVPGHGLVDGVVHHLVHEMVQTAAVGAADVHGGPLAHGLQPFKDSDGIRCICLRRFWCHELKIRLTGFCPRGRLADGVVMRSGRAAPGAYASSS